jgi:hypothetical protein
VHEELYAFLGDFALSREAPILSNQEFSALYGARVFLTAFAKTLESNELMD